MNKIERKLFNPILTGPLLRFQSDPRISSLAQKMIPSSLQIFENREQKARNTQWDSWQKANKTYTWLCARICLAGTILYQSQPKPKTKTNQEISEIPTEGLKEPVVTNPLEENKYQISPSSKNPDLVIFPNGLIFKCRLKTDKTDKSAYKKFYLPNIEAYKKDIFQKNIDTGHVVILFGDGDMYHGDFQKGLREGFGSYVWANGDTYVGLWESNEMTGLGRLSKGNLSFEGEFVDGCLMNGTVTINPLADSQKIIHYKNFRSI